MGYGGTAPLVLGAMMARYRTGLWYQMAGGWGVIVWGSGPTQQNLSSAEKRISLKRPEI